MARIAGSRDRHAARREASMGNFASRAAESFEFREILYAKTGGIARITINRPDAFNAYSTCALQELATAFRDVAFDDAIGVAILTGAGDRAFCTGGDVKEYEREYVSKPRDYWKYMGLFRAYIESILDCGKPTIARLNGMAVGGGNESQLACDLTIAAEHAYLKQVGVHVGSVACGGATQWLPLAIGDKRARQMLMLGDTVPARRAAEWGLVNEVAPSVRTATGFVEQPSVDEIRAAEKRERGYSIDLSKLDEAVDRTAARLLESFPECMRYTKQQTNVLKEFVWHQTIGHARDWLALHYTCLEPIEGMSAFVEKRRPDYAGVRRRAAEGGSSEMPWGAYTRSCSKCGAHSLPAALEFCGACGKKL
jgi:enoyl-CoA hydratase/carnithine racemase